MLSELSPNEMGLVNAYEMPHVGIGEAVIYHPHGIRDRQRQSIGFVIRCAARNVTLRDATGKLRQHVGHVDDPLVRFSADHREDGAWEFTESAARLRELEERVEAMEEVSPTVESKREQGLERARYLITQEGMSIAEAAKKVRYMGVKIEDVEAMTLPKAL